MRLLISTVIILFSCFAANTQAQFVRTDGCYKVYYIKNGDSLLIETQYYGTDQRVYQKISDTSRVSGANMIGNTAFNFSSTSYVVEPKGANEFIIKYDLIRDNSNQYDWVSGLPAVYQCRMEGINIRITSIKRKNKAWKNENTIMVFSPCEN